MILELLLKSLAATVTVHYIRIKTEKNDILTGKNFAAVASNNRA